MSSGKEALYQDVSEETLAEAGVERSTMMGFPCLRLDGKFFASLDREESHDLVVKLPAARVSELIEGGTGTEFAPAGKVFKEWVAIPAPDETLWRALLAEAMAFAAG